MGLIGSDRPGRFRRGGEREREKYSINEVEISADGAASSCLIVTSALIGDRSEGISSYSMPQGDQQRSQGLAGSSTQLYDATYDGIWDGSLLRQGLGQLTDGKLGQDNFKQSYHDHDRGFFSHRPPFPPI